MNKRARGGWTVALALVGPFRFFAPLFSKKSGKSGDKETFHTPLIHSLMKNLYLLFSLLIIGLPMAFAQQPSISITPFLDATYTLGVSNLPTPKPRPGARELPAWGFFWEFGDGHYSTDSKAYHAFRQKGPLTIRVYLTPRYSSSAPMVIEYPTPFTPEKLGAPEKPRRSSPLLKIRTNQELVPNQEMQVVLHYQAPNQAISGGHIVLFYNQARESGLSYKPFFLDPQKVRAYYEEEVIDSLPATLRINPHRGLQDRLGDSDYQVFKIEKMKANEAQRLFLSIKAYEDLLRVPGKKLSYTAYWFPDGVAFDPGEMVAVHTMKIQKAHDPNYIRVSPEQLVLYPGSSDRLHYTVRFFNSGKGEAQKVRIFVPLDRGLDPSSLRVISAAVGEDVCDTCKAGEDLRGCLSWRVMADTLASNVKDSAILFTYHEVSLLGKKDRKRRKDSKGELVYSIATRGLKRDEVKAQGFIVFNQGKTEFTNVTRTKFVRQGWGIKGGIAFPGALTTTLKSRGPRLFLGVNYTVNPVNTGLGKGVELLYQPLLFDRITLEPTTIPSGGEIERFTEIRMRSLDLTGSVHHSVGRFFSLGAGVGIGLPLATRVTQLVTVRDGLGAFADDAGTTQQFGLLASSANNVDEVTFSQFGYVAPLGEKGASLAFLGHIQGSVLGVNSGLSLQLRVSFRHYPRLYTGQNISMVLPQLSLTYKL